MASWRTSTSRPPSFAVLARNATPAAAYFNLPPDQTVEVGITIEL